MQWRKNSSPPSPFLTVPHSLWDLLIAPLPGIEPRLWP